MESIQRRTLHESFLTMINASIKNPDKWDASEILTYWWEIAFPTKEMTEEDLNENTIDNIRAALLQRGGMVNPVLKETTRTKFIKKSLIFTEE